MVNGAIFYARTGNNRTAAHKIKKPGRRGPDTLKTRVSAKGKAAPRLEHHVDL